MRAKPKPRLQPQSRLARRLDTLALAPLATRAWRRGVLGGERHWLVVGAVLWVARRIRRREAEVVYSESLAKGQTLRITHQPAPPTRRAGRRAKRRELRTAERAEPVATAPE
ncbi:MAG: hypothetical protein ACRDX8_03790 [Acidimicrobiales bacterium]